MVSGIPFHATLVRCLARNFNRIKVAFQGLGGGEALLNRRIVTSEATVNIAEEVTGCSNQSGTFVFPFGSSKRKSIVKSEFLCTGIG